MDKFTELAQRLTTDQVDRYDSGLITSFRVSTVTTLEATAPYRLQCAISGTAWLSRDSDSTFVVGDTVWIIQQGAVWFVAGRISGGEGTPIGSLTAYAGASAPAGWLICDGSAISRTTYARLFAVLGTTYGAGNGTTTFNIPDLRGKFAMGVSGSHVIGSSGGAETVTLSSGQLPAHSHSIPEAAGTTTVASGAGATVANSTAGSTGSVGSGSSVSILNPYVAMPHIIRAL
jgi:microcystin-dependent protein